MSKKSEHLSSFFLNHTPLRKQLLYFFGLTCLMMLCITPQSQAQISFSDNSPMLGDTAFFTYLTKGVCDMNDDQLDDIIRSSFWGNAYILYQQEDGSFNSDSIGQISYNAQLTTAIGDLDNNGYKDIFSGGAEDGLKVIYNNGDHTYEIDTLDGTPILVQGTNVFDINADGLLDLFACNDDGISHIWLQNNDGSFLLNDNYINMYTNPVSDNSGNYGSVWTDIDNDGDTDLYIAKCRAGATEPDDPRRINALFLNDGLGNYTEDAASRGIASGRQSWCADFGDIDNDGDMDLFIANHHDSSQLLLNDGTGYFTDITEMSLIYDDSAAYQSLFKDFDNDGFLDLLISGADCFLWKNNGDHTFTRIECPDPNNGGEPMRSFATGDLNNDGFTDIYASYWFAQFNDPIPYDKLWLNEPNENNYCTIKLFQSTANRDAIGAKVTLYAQGIQQVREIRSGESYGISNSFNQIFGLGNAAIVDSVSVQWSDATHELFVDLTMNSLNVLEKGTGITVNTNTPSLKKDIVHIYPNPITDGHLNIEFPEIFRGGTIKIYNQQGAWFYENALPNLASNIQINLKHKSILSGAEIYFLQLVSPNGHVHTQKLAFF